MRTLTITFSLLLLVSFTFAQPRAPAAPATPEFVTSVEGVKEYRLSNGLQILLVPDQAQTNVVVNVVYHVGSRYEGYGETGMAHLLEHMLFRPAVTAWLGSRKTRLGLGQYLVNLIAGDMDISKDLNFDMEYEDKAKALTVDQLNAALKKYVSPDKMTLIYAGDFR
jgi:predicted Zn-dependent peptidase